MRSPKYVFELFCLILPLGYGGHVALASETSQNYSKHYQQALKDSEAAGFNKEAMKKISSQHFEGVQKESAANARRILSPIGKEQSKKPGKAPTSTKQTASANKAATPAAPPRPKTRSGAGPGTGDMSAGATKGAEKVQFGKPQN